MLLETEIDLNRMQNSCAEASRFLRSLSNPDRLTLLCELSQGELCVGDLEERTGVAQPTLSQQLSVLRREELVATRRNGKQIYYRIADSRVLTMLQSLHEMFCSE